MADQKVSAMTTLPESHDNAVVPVVIPGDTTNYNVLLADLGGYVPVPNSPTQFLRFEDTDPGSSATHSHLLVTVPLGGIIRVKTQATFEFPDPTKTAYRTSGWMVIHTVYIPNLNHDDGDSWVMFNQEGAEDATFDMPGLAKNLNEDDGLDVTYSWVGMSDGTVVNATIEVQITSIAPTPRSSTATGL